MTEKEYEYNIKHCINRRINGGKIAFVGFKFEYKNTKYILDALYLIKSNYIDWQLRKFTYKDTENIKELIDLSDIEIIKTVPLKILRTMKRFERDVLTKYN